MKKQNTAILLTIALGIPFVTRAFIPAGLAQGTELSSLKKSYEAAFAREEKQLMQQFCTLCGITEAEWHRQAPKLINEFLANDKQAERNLLAAAPKAVEQRLQEIFDTVLAKKGMRKGLISLIADSGTLPPNAMMCAGSCYIVVNEPMIEEQQVSDVDLAALLCHELEHIKRKDYEGIATMASFAVQQAESMKPKERTAFERKLDKHQRSFNLFREKRVDLTVGLTGFDMLESRCRCTPPEVETNYSPSKENHLQYMLKLAGEMKQAVPEQNIKVYA